MPTLADIYSLIDSAKRRAADTVQNPGASLSQFVESRLDPIRNLGVMSKESAEETARTGQLFGPKMRQLGEQYAAAYNPTGMTGFVRGEKPIQSAVIKIGDKLFMGRTHGDALNRAIYEGVVRKQNGKYIYPKNEDLNMDLFLTREGKLIDRWGALFDYDFGGAETAIEKNLMQNNPAWSATIEEFKRNKKWLTKSAQ